ncbi:hypothetical protein niasHT_024859 [Heterodera trifolii]|uniref:Uncharacterized protein n=1 Tax=Heterodera trifolii TaxID=157864 RepID=A0ABD2JGC1_9BILA
MVLPVISHRLTKIRSENRIRLIKTAFVFSLCAAVANLIEVLKYYVFPNRTIDNEDKLYPPTYYKALENEILIQRLYHGDFVGQTRSPIFIAHQWTHSTMRGHFGCDHIGGT